MLERMGGMGVMERGVRGATKAQLASLAELDQRDQLVQQVLVFLELQETKAAVVPLVSQDPVVCEADLERTVNWECRAKMVHLAKMVNVEFMVLLVLAVNQASLVNKVKQATTSKASSRCI